MKKYLIIFLLLGLFGCKAKTPIIQVPIKTVEKKVTTLVPFYLPGDSATLTALFECDSMNNVLLKNFAEQKGKNMQSDISFKNGKLDYKAIVQNDTVYVPSDTIYASKEIPVYIEVPKVEYRQKWYHKLFYNIGLWGSIIMLMYVTIKLKLFK